MKVLFITSYYQPAIEWGGPAICVPSMAEGLKSLGLEITVVTTNARGKQYLPKMPAGLKQVNGVPVYYFNRVGPARYFMSIGMFYYLWKNLDNFDLIHIHGLWSLPSLLGSRLCQIRKKPYLITFHGLLVEWAMSQKAIKKILYLTLFEEYTIAHARRIHFTSEFEKHNSIKKFPEHKSVVIPNPIAIEKYLKLEPLSLKKARKGKIVFSIIGRLHPVKGFDLLIPALSMIKNSCEFELLIIGPDEENYLNYINEMVVSLSLNERVQYLGLLQGDPLIEVYERSDVIVVSSYQENFGMSAAEGMASARPVIVSNKVGIADLVIKYQAGWIFEPSIPALVDRLITAINQPELLCTYGMNGRKAALENFTRISVAEKLMDVYNAILTKQPA